MRVLAVLALILALAGGAAVWWWTVPADRLAARFQPEACRVLALTDAATGEPIAGIEDIALWQGELFLSAHDRAAFNTAEPGEAVPAGAIYRLPVARLGERRLKLSPEPMDDDGPLYPHGIDTGGGKLAAVIRQRGADGRQETAIRVYAIRPDRLEQLRRYENPALCPANDLAFRGRALYVTLDRQNCPGVSISEMAFSDPAGRLVRLGVSDASSGRIWDVAEGLTFPNGVVRLDDGMAVAETRAARLTLPDGRQISLPGGPDNLSLDSGGGIVAAVHPDLMRLGLHLRGWSERSPARILRVTPESGAVEVLHDDPEGRFLNAISSALVLEEGLVAGAVRDPGLLVCGSPEAGG